MAIAQSLLDDLWDFSDPAKSERRLRAAAAVAVDAGARAELDTQVARSLGLQERYDEADAVLDGIRSPSQAGAVRIALCSTPARDVPRLVEALVHGLGTAS